MAVHLADFSLLALPVHDYWPCRKELQTRVPPKQCLNGKQNHNDTKQMSPFYVIFRDRLSLISSCTRCTLALCVFHGSSWTASMQSPLHRLGSTGMCSHASRTALRLKKTIKFSPGESDGSQHFPV
eukprot:scpid102432/ scgid17547/ 